MTGTAIHYITGKQMPPPGVGVSESWPDIAAGVMIRPLAGISGASRPGGSGLSRFGGVQDGES
jgi:hypothetical protein